MSAKLCHSAFSVFSIHSDNALLDCGLLSMYCFIVVLVIILIINSFFYGTKIRNIGEWCKTFLSTQPQLYSDINILKQN